jgi:hypothetical protein
VIWWATQVALAGGWGQPHPYAYPVLNIGVVSVAGGESAAQASIGMVGGARVKYRDGLGWLWDTRGSAIGTYGLNTGSLGADLRVGSFLGPDGKFVTYQLGPEFWFDGYGNEQSVDYQLAWSPGIDLFNQLTLKPIPEVHLIGQVIPGFAFEESRRANRQVAPFDELTLAALLDLRTPVLGLTVGWMRQYQSYGKLDGLILSGGF